MKIIVIGLTEGHDRLRAALAATPTSIGVYEDRADYITHLADDEAALVVVDGRDPHWKFWITAPKTSPATRRIPIVLISDDPVQMSGAEDSGAALVISPDELFERLPSVILQIARVPSPEAVTALLAQCDDPLPSDAVDAIERFNAGDYYRQHDLFEALWMDDPRPVRDLYRSILQIGIAYYQIQRGNWRGAHKMLLRSQQWLALLPDECQGVDVAALRADAAAVRAELERVGTDGMAEFNKSLLKPVRIKPSR